MRVLHANLNTARRAVVRAFLHEASPAALTPWRRLRAGRLFISLALGVVTSVAIAELIAAKYSPSDPSSVKSLAWRRPGTAEWVVRFDHRGNGFRYQVYSIEYNLTVRGSTAMVPAGGWMPSEDVPVPIATSSMRAEPEFVAGSNEIEVYSFGWPVPCLQRTKWAGHSGCFYTVVETKGLVSIGDRYEMPYQPKPIGLAANSTVYGLAWLVMIAWTREAARAGRVSAGLCPACGYSRAGIDASAACPECGAAGLVKSEYASRSQCQP